MNLRDSIGVLLMAALLLVLCMAGVAWILLNRQIFTVDGLFMALILLTIAGAVAFELLFELRQRDAPEGSAGRPAVTARTAAATGSSPSATTGILTETAVVEKVEFYEAPVGQPNRSLVSLRDAAGKPDRMMTFEGNVQHLLTPGRRVRITYRPGPLNVLVDSERA